MEYFKNNKSLTIAFCIFFIALFFTYKQTNDEIFRNGVTVFIIYFCLENLIKKLKETENE